jgi:hypothetical protein
MDEQAVDYVRFERDGTISCARIITGPRFRVIPLPNGKVKVVKEFGAGWSKLDERLRGLGYMELDGAKMRCLLPDNWQPPADCKVETFAVSD